MPQIDIIEGNPNYVGISRIYFWKHLDPAEGQYDLSYILDDYETAAAAGLYFGVVVGASAYGGTPNVPDYVLGDPAYGGSTSGEHGLCTNPNNPQYTFPTLDEAAARQPVR